MTNAIQKQNKQTNKQAKTKLIDPENGMMVGGGGGGKIGTGC